MVDMVDLQNIDNYNTLVVYGWPLTPNDTDTFYGTPSPRIHVWLAVSCHLLQEFIGRGILSLLS